MGRSIHAVERLTPAPVVPAIAADYVALRERLLVVANGRPLRALVFAGCAGGEGSGDIVRAFAESLACSSLKVLLLDVAPRRDVAAAAVDLMQLVARDGTASATACGSGQLTVVAGPTADADKERFYRSTEFASWLDRQRGRYDYVLLDAPPIVRFADGTLLGRLCDGVILVVGAGTTHREALVLAREQLDRSGVKVIGAVLNRARDQIPALLRPYFPESELRNTLGD
jgi:Mrp family chromosome partitioning ATPase